MDVRLNVSYERVYRLQKLGVSGPMCNDLFYHVVICTTISHYVQVHRTQKVCVSGPKFIGLFLFLVLVGTTTSQNIGHLFFNTLQRNGVWFKVIKQAFTSTIFGGNNYCGVTLNFWQFDGATILITFILARKSVNIGLCKCN